MNETSVLSVLGEVRKVGNALGASTYYNLEELEAVVRAAEAPRAPTIVLVSPSSFESTGARGSCAASRPRSPAPRRTF